MTSTDCAEATTIAQPGETVADLILLPLRTRHQWLRSQTEPILPTWTTRPQFWLQ